VWQKYIDIYQHRQNQDLGNPIEVRPLNGNLLVGEEFFA
jgi:hypothetical protein